MGLGRIHCAFCVILCHFTGVISVGTDYNITSHSVNEDYHSSSTYVLAQRSVSKRQAGSDLCVIPSPLENGRYTPSEKRCKPGNTSPACQMAPGAFVPPDWVIFFKCDPGYKLNTTQYIAACINGRWAPSLPSCEEVPTLKPCTQSVTTVKGKNEQLNACGGDVIFEDTFRGTLSDKWKHVVMIGDTPDDLFNVFRSDSANSFTSKGKLVIKPLMFNDSDVTSGSINLEGCTAPPESKEWLCKRKGFPFSILPPVASARITTRDSFSFRYGIVEIGAKFPKGDWLVPELWLEPKDHYYGPDFASGRVRIAMSRGNSDLRCEGEDFGLQRLESGVLLGAENNVKKRSIRTRLPDNWHREYHNYTLVWKPGSISFKIDGERERELVYDGGRLCGSHDLQTVAQDECSTWINGSNIAPLDKDFYISLGLATGNERDFPDDCFNRGRPKPWKNLELMSKLKFWQDRESWLPTWTDDASSLYIDHVRVTAL